LKRKKGRVGGVLASHPAQPADGLRCVCDPDRLGVIGAREARERTMPTMKGLTRLARIATMPETRRLVLGAAHSEALRDVARRAAREPGVLGREMRNPAVVKDLFRTTIRHPATHEIGSLGLLFVPGRYLPVGWAATWAVVGALAGIGGSLRHGSAETPVCFRLNLR
jgi:hypothetical protein